VTGQYLLRREMGCTRAEFFRYLPGATRHAQLEIDGDRITVPILGGCLEIELAERPVRRIGSFALPVLAVTFRFTGLDEATRDDFLAYFDLCTRRGGG
jgi:hypothetical protein